MSVHYPSRSSQSHTQPMILTMCRKSCAEVAETDADADVGCGGSAGEIDPTVKARETEHFGLTPRAQLYCWMSVSVTDVSQPRRALHSFGREQCGYGGVDVLRTRILPKLAA